ncbi:hypothetical protein C2845_PM11G27850 [Panicum miliaceum]|uniref:Uncharacterized protein n=1 Tax=Panicum miliaceum TaxID=4540 RepID=A0A3L6RRR5_PANMI|nr:hypothetical protein C2845_PM11G27850 [Panicum miliaceum]
MVSEGEAENGTVADAPLNNIYKAHPELVLQLRGQVFFDMLQEGHIAQAQLYYQGSIQALYPDGTDTGSLFVDKMLMRIIRQMARTGLPPGGQHAFANGEKTRQRVKDYLKVYFPAYRPQLRQGTSKVWEFGETNGAITHCLVCHKDFRGFDLRKLRYHLIALGGGRQGKCQGVTPYTGGRLAWILADEGYNPDGSRPGQQQPPNDNDGNGGGGGAADGDDGEGADGDGGAAAAAATDA